MTGEHDDFPMKGVAVEALPANGRHPESAAFGRATGARMRALGGGERRGAAEKSNPK